MGSKNISISDEAYSRLASMKGEKESFTDVINRLAGKRSLLDLVGLLTPAEADEFRVGVKELRLKSSRRLDSRAGRKRKP